MSESGDRWYQNHREEIYLKNRSYYREHKDQIRLEHARYYQENKEKIKARVKANYHNGDKQRRRQTTLHINGKRVGGLNKRLYPEDDLCELCDHQSKRLSYHHWDGQNLNKGLWLCIQCHRLAEAMDKGENYPTKYLVLKAKVENGVKK